MQYILQLLAFNGIVGTQAYLFLGALVLFFVAAITLIFLLFRIITRRLFKGGGAFALIVLEVRVPKFSSEEGRQGATDPHSQVELSEKISKMETIFAQIAGLRAQRGAGAYFKGRTDHMAFEIVLRDELIHFYVVVPDYLRQFIEEQIAAQLPESVIEEVSDYNIFQPQGAVVGSMLGFKKEYIFPIKTYRKLETDSLNALTNALSGLDPDAGIVVQYVIRSAKGEWHRWGQKAATVAHQGKPIQAAIREARGGGGVSGFVGSVVSSLTTSAKQEELQKQQRQEYRMTQMEQEIIKGIEEKAARGGLDVNIRIIVSAQTEHLAQQYLENVLNSFSQFNIYEYGNAFRRVSVPKKKLVHDFIYREFDERHSVLLNTEEMTTVFHFPLGHTDTPNILWLQAKSAPAPTSIPKEGLYLGDNVYRGRTTPVYIKREDRRRHMYVIGMTGTGKSKWLDSLALQDIANGEGVCFIDPHGDDVDLIMSAIPQERAKDVIVFDPADYERPIAINMLEYDPAKPEQKTFAVNEVLAIFEKLYDLSATGGPMFEQYMRNALLLIMDDPESGSTLMEVSRVLADEGFRKLKLSRCKTPVVKEFWEKEAQKAGGEAALVNMVPYITSKLTPFIANDLVRPIIAQQKSSLDFRKAMDEKKIILVKLAKGKIGDINANLLGMIVIGKILMAALGRSDIPENRRNDFYLYVDEFQNFLTESINVILSEARKYRLSLTIAHQFLGQLNLKGDEKIKKAIFGNVGTKICFRIGVEDAEEMAKEFSPVFNEYDLINVPAYNAFMKLLVDNANPAPFNVRVPFVGDSFEFSETRARHIAQYSRLTYGKDRSLVELEVQQRSQSKRRNEIDELFV